jgi:DNA-binding transcriptional ArsR family regulator
MAAILPPKGLSAPMSTSTMIEVSGAPPAGCYIEPMIPGPLIAEIAGLVGEPARATMLSALLDGRALTATELAYAARVTPQTASTHLAKLAEAGLVAPIRDGRYRYFRLASPRVAQMLDGIMAVALDNRPRHRPLSRQAREMSAARICYDHLAGRLSVDLTDSLITHEYIVVGDEAAEITQAGARFLTEFGIDLSALSSRGRRFCRLCLDWTERRPHIAGAVGAALAKRCFDLGWTERMKYSGAVIVTASGRRGFLETFGIGVPEDPGNGTGGGPGAPAGMPRARPANRGWAPRGRRAQAGRTIARP